MTDPFDPELHLRLAGERALLDPTPPQRRPPWEWSLAEAAAALVAIGRIELDRAQQIVEDYEMALGLRGRSHFPPGFPGHLGQPGLPRRQIQLRASRICVCDHMTEHSWGTLRVHFVALGERSTSVAITVQMSGPGPFGGASRMRPNMPSPQQQLTDDQGRSEIAHFSGGGGGIGVGMGGTSGLRGRLTTHQPLSRGTKWIEIGGDRVQLVSEPDPLPVMTEALPERDPVERYLWSRITAGRHGPHGGHRPLLIDVGVETLVAAGAIAANDPTIDDVRTVLSAFSGQALPATIGEPWRSLLAVPHPAGGPSGIIPLGVVTPTFDDMTVSFEAMVLDDGVFEVHVETSPAIAQPLGPMPLSLVTPISWWAEDDLGNHYLGAITNWGGGADTSFGTVTYWPALKLGATEIRLTPTGSNERAVIVVPLSRLKEDG